MLDEGFPPAFQEAVMRLTGVTWEVVDLEAKHDAFEGWAGEVLGIVERLAGVWGNMS